MSLPSDMHFDLSDEAQIKSYVMTFQTACVRLAYSKEIFSDEKWLIMFSNMLRTWFSYESDFVDYNQSLIKVLIDRGLFPLDVKELFYDSRK